MSTSSSTSSVASSEAKEAKILVQGTDSTSKVPFHVACALAGYRWEGKIDVKKAYDLALAVYLPVTRKMKLSEILAKLNNDKFTVSCDLVKSVLGKLGFLKSNKDVLLETKPVPAFDVASYQIEVVACHRAQYWRPPLCEPLSKQAVSRIPNFIRQLQSYPKAEISAFLENVAFACIYPGANHRGYVTFRLRNRQSKLPKRNRMTFTSITFPTDRTVLVTLATTYHVRDRTFSTFELEPRSDYAGLLTWSCLNASLYCLQSFDDRADFFYKRTEMHEMLYKGKRNLVAWENQDESLSLSAKHKADEDEDEDYWNTPLDVLIKRRKQALAESKKS